METWIKNKNNILKIHDNYTSTNRLSEETCPNKVYDSAISCKQRDKLRSLCFALLALIYIIGKGTGLIYNKDINYYIPIKELT